MLGLGRIALAQDVGAAAAAADERFIAHCMRDRVGWRRARALAVGEQRTGGVRPELRLREHVEARAVATRRQHKDRREGAGKTDPHGATSQIRIGASRSSSARAAPASKAGSSQRSARKKRLRVAMSKSGVLKIGW